MTKGTRPPAALVRRLITQYATEAGISPGDVHTARRRYKAAVWARWSTIHNLRSYGLYSTTGIGMVMGLDHTSVINALRRPISPTPPPLPKYFYVPPAHLQVRI